MSKTEQINTTPKKRMTAFIEILTKSGLIGNKEISEEKIREAKRKKQEKIDFSVKYAFLFVEIAGSCAILINSDCRRFLSVKLNSKRKTIFLSQIIT